MEVRRFTREERKARTRAELLEAAARVFARKGYRAASVDDVAAEAGYTKGAFYSNFESKEDVFATLVEDRSKSWVMAVARGYAGAGPLGERLRSGGKVLTRMLEQESDWILLSYELWGQSVRDEKLRLRIAACYEECRTVVATLIEGVEVEFGKRPPMPADQIAALTIAMTDGFALQMLADPRRFPPRLLADGLNLFFAGVLSASTAGG
jgi:AcrR family transcriptional regulator